MKSKKTSTKVKCCQDDELSKEPIPAPVKKSLIRILNEYRELKDLSKKSKTFRKFRYSSDSMLKWTAVLTPQREPYNKAAWRIQFQMPPDYPQRPPKLKFLTPIYHPNVSPSGDVKLDVLGEKQWRGNMHMTSIVETLEGTLDNPKAQTKDGKLVLNKKAATNLKLAQCSFNRKAKKLAEKEALARQDAKSKGKPKKDDTDTSNTDKSENKSEKSKKENKSDKTKKEKSSKKPAKTKNKPDKAKKVVQDKPEKSKKAK